MGTLLSTLIYNAPWLIAWYRWTQGHPLPVPLLTIFLMNFFLGWTVVGWVLPLAFAFNYNPVPWVALWLVKLFPPSGHGTTPSNSPSEPPGTTGGESVCGQCGGSGAMACSSCGGRGSWFDVPTTAGGSAELRNCGACTSSGRLRCTYCGGSGKRNF